VENRGIGVNLVPLVGHGTLRVNTAGFTRGHLSQEVLAEMEALLAASLDQGAFGMSSGLGYAPCCFADTEELVALGRILKKYGGFFSVHMRDQGDRLLESIREVIIVGEEAGIPVDISHIKASGKRNWGKMREAIDIIESARSRGVNVICDFYPYTAAENTLIYELPMWLSEQGLAECIQRLGDAEVRRRIRDEIAEKDEEYWNKVTIIRVGADGNQGLKGHNLAEIARDRGLDAIDAVCDLLIEEKLGVEVVAEVMCESDVRTAAEYSYAAVGSDAYAQAEDPSRFFGHPRNYGCFPRFLRDFVFSKKLLTLEEGVRRCTSLPASFVGLKDRGTLQVGKYADLVVMDAGLVRDCADYRAPAVYPEGIRWVIVNGKVQVDGSIVNHIPCGRVLRRG
jgi:N-acyl-D-amino-acid deacylase